MMTGALTNPFPYIDEPHHHAYVTGSGVRDVDKLNAMAAMSMGVRNGARGQRMQSFYCRH